MKKSGVVRIISGSWRSRQLRFPLARDLRPSPDAVRETLFNWLQTDIHDSHCLDLFAGSGAIGFEAASRGASSVDMVESQSGVFSALQSNCALLNGQDFVTVHCSTADAYLEQCKKQFDIVFLDPPFDSNYLQRALHRLQKYRLLSASALIYIESRFSKEALPLPENWHIIREKRCGEVLATLVATD